jgi:hypothetical protein
MRHRPSSASRITHHASRITADRRSPVAGPRPPAGLRGPRPSPSPAPALGRSRQCVCVMCDVIYHFDAMVRYRTSWHGRRPWHGRGRERSELRAAKPHARQLGQQLLCQLGDTPRRQIAAGCQMHCQMSDVLLTPEAPRAGGQLWIT